MSRINTNAILIPRWRNGLNQWFSIKKSYASLLMQDKKIRNAVKYTFMRVKKTNSSLLYSTSIMQKSYNNSYLYVPCLFMKYPKNIFYYHRREPGRFPFFPYYEFAIKNLYYGKKRFHAATKKRVLSTFLYRLNINKKEMYFQIRSLLYTPIAIRTINMLYLEPHINLFMSWMAFHLGKKKDLKIVQVPLQHLLNIGQEHVEPIGGLHLCCKGRLSVRKVLRKQKQWVKYGNVSINHFNQQAFFSKDIAYNKFGTHGLKGWLNVDVEKAFASRLINSLIKKKGTQLKLSRYREYVISKNISGAIINDSSLNNVFEENRAFLFSYIRQFAQKINIMQSLKKTRDLKVKAFAEMTNKLKLLYFIYCLLDIFVLKRFKLKRNQMLKIIRVIKDYMQKECDYITLFKQPGRFFKKCKFYMKHLEPRTKNQWWPSFYKEMKFKNKKKKIFHRSKKIHINFNEEYKKKENIFKRLFRDV